MIGVKTTLRVHGLQQGLVIGPEIAAEQAFDRGFYRGDHKKTLKRLKNKENMRVVRFRAKISKSVAVPQRADVIRQWDAPRPAAARTLRTKKPLGD